MTAALRTFTGVLSLVTFIYVAFVHVTLILATTTYPTFAEFAFFSSLMTRQVAALHVTVCVFGALVAIAFIIHAFRNPALSVRRRLLWAFTLAIGYGLIFYWYKHLARPDGRGLTGTL